MPPEPETTSFEFRDFDAFREQLRGWDTEPVQLGAGALRVEWNELRLPEFGVSHLAVNRRIADTSAVAPGWLAFCVSLRPHIWCGMEVPPGSLVVISPGRDIRSAHRQGFRSVEIVASEELLHDIGLLTDGIDPRALPPERCIVRLGPRFVAEFARLTTLLRTRGGTAEEARVSGAWAAAMQQRTLSLVVRALTGHEVLQARRVPRYPLALAALRLMEENRTERLGASAVAKHLGVTPRALEYAFRSALGDSPARFLLACRLNLVRRDLLANEDDTVTAAASRRGFYHLGRFSAQYRRLFDVLPSQTKRAASQATEG